MIVISANSQAAAWTSQTGFLGDRELVTRACSAALWSTPVSVHPMLPAVVAGSDTPMGAFAALSWAAGGRERLVKAPVEVLTFFSQVQEVSS
jgi:hypothetical protein